MGLCALCRQNLILLGPILGVLLFFYLKRGPYRALLSLTFVVSFCVILALLPLRNYVVTGEASIPVIRHTAEHVGATLQIDSRLSAGAIFTKAVSAFVYYVKRILFCAGVTVTLDLPWYYLKPHWLVIWFGALLYLGRVLRRRRLEFWEAFASTLIVTYLLPLIAFADISNYGVRMVIPVMPVVFALCSSLPGKASSTVRKE